MKKKLALLLVFLILITNVTIPAMASTTAIEVDASKSATQVSASLGNSFSQESGIRIIEYEFEFDSGNPKDAGVFLSRSNPSRAVPLFLDASEQKLHFACGFSDSGELTESRDYVAVTEGKYYCVAIIDPANNKMEIYVNGTKTYDADARIVWAHRWLNINAYPGTKAVFYNMDDSVTLDNFDYSVWTARLESDDSIVRVDNDTMVINAGREEMSAGTLLSKLTLPEGAAAKVTNDGTEVASDVALTNDMKVDVTLKYGNSISYSIENGFVLLTSDSFDVSVELDGNEVIAAVISGVKEFTPCDEFLSSVALGKDGEEIIGLEPSGDFVNKDMKLKVKTVDEETVSFDIILSASFTAFEEQGGVNKIADLEGKLKEKEIIIKGTAEIPEEGLSEKIELCFEMDSKKAYPIQFNTDGSISIYGNSAGSFANNSSYDYAIITNAEAGTASAYINGIKVIDEADITSQLTSDDDPLELVGGSYDPAQYGDFLLAPIYSVQSFEEIYSPSLAMLSDESSGIVISFDSEEGAVVNIYTEDGAMLSDLSGMIMAAGNGVIEYFDADGNEITFGDSPASSVARIDVTSENGLYTNSYKAIFPDGYIASSLYDIDEDNLTIGELPYLTLAGVLLEDVKVARPDYTMEGIYRGGTKLGESDALIKGDVFRISKGVEIRNYEIKFISNFVPGTPATTHSFDFSTETPTATTKAQPIGINPEILMGEKGIKIYEFEFTYPEVPEGAKHLSGLRFGDSGGDWSMVAGGITDEDGNEKLVFESGLALNQTAGDKREITSGETYKMLVVMDVQENGISRLSTYVNGELIRNKVKSKYYVNDDSHKTTSIAIYEGGKGTVYLPNSQYPLDDFSYSDWTARLSSGDEVVTVDNTLMKVDAGRAEMTAGTLLSKLTIPDGAAAKITDGGVEVASDTILTTDMKIDVTLKFGNSVSYDVITGFIPVTSETYKTSVVLDGESVASAKISGIKNFTPAEKFTEALVLGKDGEEIIGLEPSGDFITDDMKLKVKTTDGDTVAYDLELTPSFNSFEEHGGAKKIRNLHGIFKGEKSVIKGTAKIPEEGLTENLELYFEMDIKQAYPVQFNTDGSVSVYGNNVGSFVNNTSYDYVIITDAEAGIASAYINGMKVLENADITGQLTSDDDPYDLVGGTYDPAGYGSFLLAEIYSAESFEEFYAPDIAMPVAMNSAAAVSYDMAEGALVKLFVNKSSTLAELAGIIQAIGGGSIKYFDADGNEITSPDSPATSVARIEVTSKSGLHKNSYSVLFPDELIKSTLYSVDEVEMTIGELLHFAPASELLDTVTVVNPDYVLDGIYRGEKKLEGSDVLIEGDVLRITKASEARDYLIEYTPDFDRDGTTLMFPETSQHVTVFEGKFTVPEEGFTEQSYSVWYKTWATSEGRSVMEFTTDLKLKLWRSEFQLEKGKTYYYAYVHDHKNAAYDFYLNGTKVAGESLTYTLAPETGFDNFWARGPLGEEGGVERAFRAYSRENYVYKNDLSIGIASPNTVTMGTNNVINVIDSSCKTVGDLLNALTFKSETIKDNLVVKGNGAVITDNSTELRSGMVLTAVASGGFEVEYRINVAHSPVTSWVFDVEDSTITYDKGNLTLYDFTRYALLADGCELVVKKANGEVVTSGNIESGMTAEAGGKTYTISLTASESLPTVTIVGAEDGEILKTTDTYSKTVNVTGEGVTGVTIYLDGEKYVLGTQAGSHTFAKENLTSGRHELYAVAETLASKVETEHFIFYAFEEETDRVRAALQPAVMEVNYLDSDGAAIPVSDTVSYDKVSMIELVFNKALSVESVTEENISLYLGDTRLEAALSYEENVEEALYTVTLSDFGALSSSSDYEIRISGELEDTKGNTAQDESKLLFKTSPKPFDTKSDLLVNESGQPVAELSGGDSVKAKVELTNTSLSAESGLIVLAVFDGSRMVGYSITPFEIEEGTVNKTVTTNAVEIHENASDNLKTYRYIWDSDINNMSTLLTQAMLK